MFPEDMGTFLGFHFVFSAMIGARPSDVNFAEHFS